MTAVITEWLRHRLVLASLILIGLLGCGLAFPLGYFANSNVLIGLVLFPFALFIQGDKRNNYVYAGASVLFAVAALVYGIRVFYFFALAFYFLWIVELCAGRLNVLVLFLIFWMSPVFVQLVTILGFPVRLMLSDWAGSILNFVGTEVRVEGNMMFVEDVMFSVDEACMGLNLLAISMLMGVSVLIYRYRLSGKMLGLFALGSFFGVVFILNLVTNLIRIVTLVYFRVLPEHPMHEFIGILCLIFYVVMPLYFISNWFMRNFGRDKEIRSTYVVRRTNVLVYLMPVLILFVGATLEQKRQASSASHANVHFTNGTPENIEDGITKIFTEDVLIYVKTIPEFFTGEHTPLLCWKGSGYKFSGVTTVTLAGVTFYKGTLVRGNDILHTAWWYTDGEVTTISQLDWRKKMLTHGTTFALVNVTTKDEGSLLIAVNSIFTEKALTVNTDH